MNRSPSKLSQYIKEFIKYKDLLKLLVSKNLKLKYRRSFLGYLWSVLNPLFIMIVMAVVFSTMFKRAIPNFPLYLFCGQLLFNFMNNSTHQAISSITGSAALLKKTYVPKYIFTLARITSGTVDLLLSFGALIIVMIATKAPFTWHALLFPIVIVQLYVFCVGLGLFLAQANVFFKDIQYIYNALTTAWMYLTPIFYDLEFLPEQLQWGVKTFNPMYYYVTQFRDIVWAGKLPEPELVGLGCLAAVIMLVIGTWSFMRSKDKFILYI